MLPRVLRLKLKAHSKHRKELKKAMKAVELTDEVVLSGYGPVGEANNQIAKAIALKVDNDAMDDFRPHSL